MPANAHLRHKNNQHMKKLILILLCALTGTVVAQAQNETLVLKPVKKGEEPQAVMAAIKKDFPKAIVGDLGFLPAKLYGEEWSADFKDNLNGAPDLYRVNLKEGNETYSAVYDRAGNVISSITIIKKAELPKEVTKAIATKYPGWKIVNDLEKIAYKKGTAKEAFHVQIQESKMNRHLLLSGSGKFLKDKLINHTA